MSRTWLSFAMPNLFESIFSDEMRRNPYPAYAQLRERSPVLHDPQSGLWLIFDYESVKRALNDQEAFSSRHGPDWLIFSDPPRHSKLRALVSQAFTPRVVTNLEPRIRELARELLNRTAQRTELDLAAEFSVPLPILVIGEMLGLPAADRPHFKRWTDVMVNMSYTVPGGAEAAKAAADFVATTAEMDRYLSELLEQRRRSPGKDLFTGLMSAEVDGERLTQAEILGFFQLLLLAGSETTTNLINNAIICFMEHPGQLARLRSAPGLLPSAIEEVLRYRSPLQWMYRKTRQDIELHGQVIPSGKLVLAMIGSANRDPRQFRDPNSFDITREPNPHIAFGHGLHFCLGAALARVESRVALSELLERWASFAPANAEPWEPRKGIHVHGPTRLPLRYEPSGEAVLRAAR
jgi:cytochrome P450